ncbi:flagellar hook-length control protein FliK [Pseudochelatococcus sp. B33]
MSAIDVASTMNGPAPAGAKSKTADAGEDGGAFSLIYESVAREPADGKAGPDGATSKGADAGKGGGPRSAVDGPATRKPAAGEAAGPEGEPADEGHAERVVADAPQKDGVEAADDLTRLLGIGTPPAQAASAAQEPQSATPLRRDVLPQPSHARNTDAEAGQRPQAARIVVIGRETHFAPVNVGSPGSPNGRPAADMAVSAPDDPTAGRIARAAAIAGEAVARQPHPAGAGTKNASTAQARAVDLKAVTVPIADEAAATGQPHPTRAGAKAGEAAVAQAGASDLKAATAPGAAALAEEAAATRAPHPSRAEAKDARAEAGFAGSRTREETARSLLPTAATGTGAQAVPDSAVSPDTGALVRLADQIVAQIVAQARELTAAGAPLPQAPHQSGGPVRILHLQLQPEELGLVTARLRIVGGVLELRLTADRQQSVEVLQQDREGLIEALRRAGYKAEVASIEFARPQALHQAPAQTAAGNGSGQSPSQEFSGQEFSGHDGGSAAGDPDRSPDRGGSGHGAANGRPEGDVKGGNGDKPARRSDEPQAIYL